MKDGQPVPDSNFEFALKRGVLQPPQLQKQLDIAQGGFDQQSKSFDCVQNINPEAKLWQVIDK